MKYKQELQPPFYERPTWGFNLNNPAHTHCWNETDNLIIYSGVNKMHSYNYA